MTKLDTMLQVGRTFGVREGMLRLQYEVQRGSGLLSWRMRSVQGWNSWSLKQIAPGAQPEVMRTARITGDRKFFFTDAQTLGSRIAKIIGPNAEHSVLTEAEQILAGNLPFFGELSYPCGFPPRWFHNPVTGQSVSPQHPWTQMRFASPVYGDLKFILEPSRFLFVYALARAYALSGDEKFPLAFWSAIEDWAHHSPPMAGPLWICGQECSLRILAWSFALQAFIHSSSTTNQRVALLVSMIAAHAWRTAQTLGYARSQRSNHLITEAVGLWTAGTLYPELTEAQVWRELGAQLLREAVLDQITPEGVSHQHSFNYQRMILHLLLWTLRLSEIHSSPLHEDIRSRAQSAYDFIRRFADPVSGLAPTYGSDDGSLIFPLAPAAYRDFRPLLQLGAAILNRPALNPGPWDEAVLWFGAKSGGKSGARPSVTEEAAAPPSVETGYFRLGDDNSWALVRAGRYTRRPFQADQLHVDLWWNGINLARDAGTYLYNGPAPWNNGLAGTAVHNTVTIDHQDQMRRAGRFLWIDWAQASGKVYSSRNQPFSDHFAGEHDGYKHLGVTHRRAVQWLQGSGWIIVDDILSNLILSNPETAGDHHARLHWLVPDWPFECTRSPFQVAFMSQQGRIRWSIFSSVPGNPALVRGGREVSQKMSAGLAPAETQLLGWESPTYGALRPAISLVQQTKSPFSVRFVTVVLTDDGCNLESQDTEIVIRREEPPSEIEYRVSLSAASTSSTEPSFPVRELPI